MNCIYLVMVSSNDLLDLLILYGSIQYLLIDSLNDLSTLLVGMRGEWLGMQAAWMAWPNPGGRRGQTR